MFSDTEVIPLERAKGLRLVLKTAKGRGVFASSDIPAKCTIEISPVLVLTEPDCDAVKTTVLDHYTYVSPGVYSNWPVQDRYTGKTTTQAVVLGLGSMFNHSTRGQNVGWERDLIKMCVRYQALRDIRKGEELCINYGPKLWFADEEDDDVDVDDDDVDVDDDDVDDDDDDDDGVERPERIEID